MKSFFTALACAAGSALLITALLIISIEIFAFDRAFFASEYEKIGVARRIGMSGDALAEVTDNLLDYTSGNRDSLDMKAVINGEYREVFDSREKEHMKDVRELYLSAAGVRTFCLAGAAALFAAAFIISRGAALRILCGSFLSVSGVFVLATALLAAYAAVDFSGFWVSFHRVFFTNDLWQLDPNTEVLINMVPERFFSDLVRNIIICFVSVFAALNVAAFWLRRASGRSGTGRGA